VENRIETHGPLKYTNKHYGFPVMTGQEQQLILNDLIDIGNVDENKFEVAYCDVPQTLFDLNAGKTNMNKIKTNAEQHANGLQYELLG